MPRGTLDPIRVNLDHMSRFAAAALLARCGLLGGACGLGLQADGRRFGSYRAHRNV
jgi:hypothetical protein